MKQALLALTAALALGGCVSPYGWSEAPLDDRYYGSGAQPAPWWGRDVASVDLFYGSLAGYGSWSMHERYGRVFLPGGVGAGWQPYSQGYWREDPRRGRMWVSSEPWGWATYHYGRWGRDSRLGWFWVPDTHFGPGWVDWRYDNGYASWAPLPPYGWSSYGYGYGNNWWVNTPGSWAYRPGMHQYLRPGRHDWNDNHRPGQSLPTHPNTQHPGTQHPGTRPPHARADMDTVIGNYVRRRTEMRQQATPGGVAPLQHALPSRPSGSAVAPRPPRFEAPNGPAAGASRSFRPRSETRSQPRGRDVPARTHQQ